MRVHPHHALGLGGQVGGQHADGGHGVGQRHLRHVGLQGQLDGEAEDAGHKPVLPHVRPLHRQHGDVGRLLDQVGAGHGLVPDVVQEGLQAVEGVQRGVHAVARVARGGQGDGRVAAEAEHLAVEGYQVRQQGAPVAALLGHDAALEDQPFGRFALARQGVHPVDQHAAELAVAALQLHLVVGGRGGELVVEVALVEGAQAVVAAGEVQPDEEVGLARALGRRGVGAVAAGVDGLEGVVAGAGQRLVVAGGGDELHLAPRGVLAQVFRHLQEGGRAARTLRSGAQGGHHRDAVIVGEDHQRLAGQLRVGARYLAADAHDGRLLPPQHGAHVGLDGLLAQALQHPVGGGVVVVGGPLALHGGRQGGQVAAAQVIARHGDGQFVVLQFRVIAEGMVRLQEDDGPGAELGGVEPAAEGVELHHHDVAGHLLAVEVGKVAVAGPDQVARQALLPRHRRAGVVRQDAVEGHLLAGDGQRAAVVGAVAGLLRGRLLAPAVVFRHDGHHHLERRFLDIGQADGLELLGDVLLRRGTAGVPREAAAVAGEELDVGGRVDAAQVRVLPGVGRPRGGGDRRHEAQQ